MASNVEITLKAIDKATKTLDGVEKEIIDVGNAADKGKVGMNNFGGAMDDTVQTAAGFLKSQIGVAAAIGATAAAIGVAAKQIFEMGQAGAAAAQTAESFERINDVMQITPGLLDKLREASNYTISDLELMSSTTKLLSGSSSELGKRLGEATPQLMEIAKAANKVNPALGTTAEMYESISVGIKRASPMILDNLGIIVKVGEANEEYARQLGKTAEQLTAEEQKIALLNGVLEQGANLLEQAGGSAESAGDSYAQLTTHINNVTNSLKTQVSTAILPVVKALDENIKNNLALDDAIKKGIITTKEANTVIVELQYGLSDYANMQEFVTEKTEEFNQKQEEAIRMLGPYQQGLYGVSAAAEEAATSEEDLAAAAEEAAKKAEEYDASIRAMKEANDVLRQSAIDARTEQLNLAMSLENMTDPTDIAKQQIKLLNEAMREDPENANIYQEQINKIAEASGLASENTIAFAGAVEILPQLLAAGVIDDYATAWQEMSDYIATDATPTFGELIEAFETAGLTSKTQAEIINDGMKLDPAIEESGRLYANLTNIVNAPLTREFNYTVHVKTTGPVGLITGGGGGGGNVTPGGGGYEGGGPMGIGYASGGSFVIPPGYSNDSYYLGAGHYGQSGEVVTVTPPNQAPAQRNDQSTELLAALLAEIRNQPRSIALAVEQAIQRIST